MAVVVGLIAAPGLPRDIAEELEEDLADDLAERHDDGDWRVELGEGEIDGATSGDEIVSSARDTLRDAGWDIGVCLTDVPLRAGRRPVTAHASATHRVGVVSVPALGAVNTKRRVRRAVLNVIEGALGESVGRQGERRGRLGRIAGRAREIGRQRPHEAGVRFVGAVFAGNLRLLAGMVRANNPALVIARLSRALVAALGTAAYAMSSSGIWQLADRMSWLRLVGIGLIVLAGTVGAIIGAHGLWERSHRSEDREQVVLFNAATLLTLLLASVVLYLALFVLCVAAGELLIPPDALRAQLGHGVGLQDYLGLAWLGATMGTVAGALGSVIESDLAVREAAYRARPDERTESGDDDSEPDD
jgi:uncharacterized membrane protein